MLDKNDGLPEQYLDDKTLRWAEALAHDILSPLAALDIMTRNLSGLSDEQREGIRSAIRRIRSISTSLPKTKVEGRINVLRPAGPLTLPKIVQGIHEIIAEKRLQYSSKPKIKLKVVSSRMGEVGKIHVQLAEILRMLSNLIDNSVEAIGNQGVILVLLHKNTNELKISVRDNGRGIPAHILPELSRRGFTFGKTHGKGLGLHMTRKLVESYGGRLEVVSQLGHGTEVILLLPF